MNRELISSAEAKHVRTAWYKRLLIALCILSFATLLVQVSPTRAGAVEGGVTVGPSANRMWNVYVYKSGGIATDFRDETLCSGSLIAREWVLTAGHCVSTVVKEIPVPLDDPQSVPLYYKRYSADSMRVAIGRPNLDDSSVGVDRNVAEIVIHPQFKRFGKLDDKPEFRCTLLYINRMCKGPATSDEGQILEFIQYDLALIHLSSPVPTDFTPVALAPSHPADGTDTFLYGYGRTSANSSPSRKLQLTRFGSYQVGCGPDSYHDYAFCLRRTGRSRTRPGDSGGPWLIGVNGTPQQIGVNSAGADDSARAAPIAGSIGWIRSTANLPTPGATDSNSIAMALVIDSSGSMTSNDPSNRRVDAGRAYLNAAGASDAVGVVDFDSGSRIASEAVNPRTNKDQLLAALNTIDSSGGTNIGAGVHSACDLLGRSGAQPAKAAILLTDGDGSYSGQNSCFKSNGWKLYTFGLGSSVNSSLLTTIAQETGGTYKSLPTPENLICEFQQIRATVAGVANGTCDPPELIKLKQLLLKAITVPNRQLQSVFSIGWPGSDIDMTIVSPSGRRITVDTDAYDVTADSGPTFKTITVYKPEAGQWQVELLGVDVAEAGEPVVFSTVHVPLANTPPTAVIGEAEIVDRSTGTFSFSALGSADPDGQLVDYLWDFGDAFAGSGNAVEHRFPEAGTYTVRLTVVDDDLETASVERVVEVPPFLTPVPFTVAGKAGQSLIYATGSPNGAGGTDGKVIGVVRGQRIPIAPITEAGLTTIDGAEVLLVRFKIDDVPWELRYRSGLFGFGFIGTIELCGPPGCETGTGVKFDFVDAVVAGFDLPAIPTSTTSSTTPGGTGSTTTVVSSTTTTVVSGTSTTTTVPVTITVTTTRPSSRCATFQRQVDQASDPRVRAQLEAAMRALGCPA